MNSATEKDAAYDASSSKIVLLTGVIVVAMFIFYDLLNGIEGGGILSIASAYKASQIRAAVVDTDGAGLRIAFIIACVIPTVILFQAMQWDIKNRWRSLLFMALTIGGGFVLDAVYDESIVGSYLISHGYSRCAARDHVVGSGKGRVWFHDYVLAAIDCHSDSAKRSADIAIPDDPRSQLPRPAKPVESPAEWFSQDDYPALALRQHIEGDVKVRFVIDKDGHVRQCNLITSSGSPLLDATTCGILITNARYWPARNSTGNAIMQIETQNVKWQIPKN
jgi:TonB family protein